MLEAVRHDTVISLDVAISGRQIVTHKLLQRSMVLPLAKEPYEMVSDTETGNVLFFSVDAAGNDLLIDPDQLFQKTILADDKQNIFIGDVDDGSSHS